MISTMDRSTFCTVSRSDCWLVDRRAEDSLWSCWVLFSCVLLRGSHCEFGRGVCCVVAMRIEMIVALDVVS